MGKGRVLLVSSDPDIGRTLQVYLDAHQFSVQTATGGEEALSACRLSPPDAVILNWNLPHMDGDDFCRQIRADERTADSFILVLLVANERQARLAALESGADDVQALPIDIEEVRLRLEEVLKH
jgi:DNA-binding response OmpR family regulator